MCRFFVISLAFLSAVNCAVDINDTLVLPSKKSYDKTVTISRKKRVLPPIPPAPPLFPSILYGFNSATGLLCALAIPVALEEYNVFVSYNFEANYNMPNIPSDSVPGPLVRLKLNEKYPAVDPNVDASYSDVVARDMKKTDEDAVAVDEAETTTFSPDEQDESERQIMKRDIPIFKTIFTRVGIYTMIESRMNADGIDGKKCLLHAICESSKVSFLKGNGVLGHILHVILTPSTSIKEKELPSEYYKAELSGLRGDCTKYEKACNLNILSLFSTII